MAYYPRMKTIPSRLHLARTFFSETPGKVFGAGLTIIILTLLSGSLAASFIVDRQTHHERVLEESEPVANAAQRLYSALSIADSAANAAFVSGGIESPGLRERYTDAIEEASAALVDATRGSGSSSTQSHSQSSYQALTVISTKLTEYTGLIETARTNNRVTNPVASSYLARASAIMQDTILPAAADFYDWQFRDFDQQQKQWSQPPWVPGLLMMGAVVLLLVLQWRLSLTNGRSINAGLFVASLMLLAALLWTGIAGLLSANLNASGIIRGAAPMNELTRARISAQQLRSEETLSLVQRSTVSAENSDREQRFLLLRSTLSTYLSGSESESNPDTSTGLDQEGSIDTAVKALDRWKSAQSKASQLAAEGNFRDASVWTTGNQEGEGARAFELLDQSLQAAIDSARSSLRTEIEIARTASTLAPTGILILTIGAVGAIVAGLAPRLREYL